MRRSWRRRCVTSGDRGWFVPSRFATPRTGGAELRLNVQRQQVGAAADAAAALVAAAWFDLLVRGFSVCEHRVGVVWQCRAGGDAVEQPLLADDGRQTPLRCLLAPQQCFGNAPIRTSLAHSSRRDSVRATGRHDGAHLTALLTELALRGPAVRHNQHRRGAPRKLSAILRSQLLGQCLNLCPVRAKEACTRDEHAVGG